MEDCGINYVLPLAISLRQLRIVALVPEIDVASLKITIKVSPPIEPSNNGTTRFL